LGDTPASRASRSRGVQPGEDWTSGGVMLPPGRLSGQTRGHSFPELLGVLTIRRVLKESQRRHERNSVVGFVGRKGRAD